ncbi:MAG TPA: hypothetical protein VGO61_02945 [Steroidobacteraceae bacterium]|jgi:hypothetical protein|nr:hypothetical protein [Steroidobacteraceae bacterium]
MDAFRSRRGILRAQILSTLSLLALFLHAAPLYAQGALKVMTQGLGTGTVHATSGSVIDCGAVCDDSFPGTTSVVLEAQPAPGSAFDGWSGDCAPFTTATICNLTTSANLSVRAQFRLTPDIPPIGSLLTPEIISQYLLDNPGVTTAAQFLRALPEEFRKGWILMSRSESLQTGTARFPRILLPSADSRYVFTFGLAAHASYPGSHPDAIEFMQWDPGQKTFRFHEIVVNTIGPMGRVGQFPTRNRGVGVDEPRCTRCHSTRNIRNPNPADAGTTGFPAGLVLAKNKPNWDTYDSWGGMLPFNRDKIFKGSVEAAAIRKLLNPWTWRADEPSRRIMEQLALQSNGAGELPVYPTDDVFTRVNGGTNDGHIKFAFDAGAIVTSEPVPVGGSTGPINYSFNGVPGAGAGSFVQRDTSIPVILHAFGSPTNSEGRGVQLFDQLGGGDGGGNFNQIRVGNELANHRFATGSVPLDARPLALAINNGCIVTDSAGNISTTGSAPAFPSSTLPFFTARHGGSNLAAIIADTSLRAKDLPRRKADIEKLNLDRTGDNYLMTSSMTPDIDLLAEYGPFTGFGTSTAIERLRQEIFRRDTSLGSDTSIMGGGFYVDREKYSFNTNRAALFRYLLEPLGVSVDKWSVGVRGRSRSYTFADVFESYISPIQNELQASLTADPYAGAPAGFDCAALVTAANHSLTLLPAASDLPRYTDIQRIFNKSCIECHGGLDYPPYAKFSTDPNYFDLSERDSPPDNNRLTGSYDTLINNGLVGVDAAGSYIFQRITAANENCPGGSMPCGGPRLAQADVETIRRWLDGMHPSTAGDPHILTIDNVAYDFQSAGEFTLLRGEGMELQARQTPVETDGPLAPNAHTGLTSCASLNTAAAVRVGGHRVTLEPDPNGESNAKGLQLRIDGKLVSSPGARGIQLPEGGRIMATPASGGIQVQLPGGTEVIITPGYWDYYQVWFLNIEVRSARATFGVMGAIAPGNWLPALPNGATFGARPTDLAKRFDQLYVTFTDQWRVTKQNSLFDYAPGTGTDKYTLKGWPAFQPRDCKLPKGWSTGLAPPKRVSMDEAKRACAILTDANRRLNCERDVAITGNLKIADTYVVTEKIEGNLRPKRVVLTYPEAFAENVGENVDFKWKRTSDKDQGKLTYMHCLWPQGEKFTLKSCKDLDGEAESTTAYGLEPGRFYYWKVVVDDGQGATVDSETRRFQVQEKK